MRTKATLIEKESGKVKQGKGEAQIWGFCCEEEMDLVRVWIMWNGWSVVCVEFGYTSNVPTVGKETFVCTTCSSPSSIS